MTVVEGWGRIVAWCAVHAPVTSAAVRPTAGPGDLSATRALFGNPWPDELVDWFEVQDGIDESPFTGNGPLPGWAPCSLGEVQRTVEDMLSTAEEAFGSGVVAGQETRPAGAKSPCWLPSFVPVAVGVAADYLVVDIRSGPHHGVLKQWSGEDGTSAGPRPSLTKLVADTASCLERGKPFRGLIADVVEGGLKWQHADHPARARPPVLPPEWQGFYRRFRDHRIAVWDDGGNTRSNDFSEAQHQVEWSAQQHRYDLMDVIDSVLSQDAHDPWNGHRDHVLNAERAALEHLASRLSSELSRRRTTEILELTRELGELMHDYPLRP